MGKYVLTAFATALVAAVALAISYYFACQGRPDSVWLWRDVLGILPSQ